MNTNRDAVTIDEEIMYTAIKKYIMTEGQLVANGFPRPDPLEAGKAVAKRNPRDGDLVSSDPRTKRMCARCKTEFKITPDGKQINEKDCVHHFGRFYTIQNSYTCCQKSKYSTGCAVNKFHTKAVDYNNLRGFVSTLQLPGRRDCTTGKVYSLDCEMCYTTEGFELIRVTILDQAGEVWYETLVKPANEIVDYNTRFSGITEQDLKYVKTNIAQVQDELISKIDAKDILIGHSLESDLLALKMFHATVVDTSVVYPHKRGPPLKKALKTLADTVLGRKIQSGEGHDSKEDALACMDIMKAKSRGCR